MLLPCINKNIGVLIIFKKPVFSDCHAETKDAPAYKLLMLSGGSLVGQNILAALMDRRNKLHITAMNSKVDEPALFDYDAVYASPSSVIEKTAFQARFDYVYKEVEPDLVIPCRDEDVAFLSNLADTNPALKTKLLCGSLNIANALLDKFLSWEFSLTNKLPFAPTINCNANNDSLKSFIASHGYPIIAKPRKGFASHGVRVLSTLRQFNSFIGRKDYIFQKYLGSSAHFENYVEQVQAEGIALFHSFEETKISIQGCIGPNGEVVDIFVTNNKMCQGKSELVSRHDDVQTMHHASQWIDVFAGAGWRGPINIQCQRDQDGNLGIYEYNGRFTGATSARVSLGLDEVGSTLRAWLGAHFPQSIIQEGNKAVLRAPISRVIDLEKVQQLTRSGYWKRC